MSSILSTKFFQRIFSNKKAENTVVASAILAGAVIALGFVTLGWVNQRTSIANDQYADVLDTNLESIKEQIVFEYLFYNSNESNLTVYLMNCGKSDNVNLATAYLSNSTWTESFDISNLRLLNGTLTQNLDIDDEGYISINVSLLASNTYSIRLITERGRAFDFTFIP
jgi:hypothetical protein